jgi:hypothetical protein
MLINPPISFAPNRFFTSRTKNSQMRLVNSDDNFDSGSNGISSFKIALVSPSFVLALNGRYVND